jgi:ribosome-associated toxin RatA of RatAB toxin-antitoxin module
MGVYAATRELIVAASAQACFDALTDYERLPDWQSRVRSCTVLARDEEGRGLEVEYEVDAKVRTVRYRLRHDYDEPWRIGSTYLGGDFRLFEGHYDFAEAGEGCRVTLRVAIDPGLRLPRPMVRVINEAVLGRALAELREHVEGAHAWR